MPAAVAALGLASRAAFATVVGPLVDVPVPVSRVSVALPLAILGPGGYGLRQGLLMAPARIGQAGAPLLFAVLLDRFGPSAVLFTAALGIAGLLALLALHTASGAQPD